MEISVQKPPKANSKSSKWPSHTTPWYILKRYPKDTCSTMFISALFAIARNWKQPRYPSIKEWIQKLWFMYTVKCYSAIKNKGIMNFAGKW